MVKLKGPMGSMGASGSLADIATFATWKGRAYARRNVVPKNPQSDLQTATRAMMAFLPPQWKLLYTPEKATWSALAAETHVSPYNAFIATNLNRWQQFQAPGQVWPVDGTGSLPTAELFAAIGGPAHVTLTIRVDNDRDVWGCTIHRSDSAAFTPSKANTIALLATPLEINYYYTDSNLKPGTYYYNLHFFTISGRLGPQEAEKSAVAT